MGSDESRMVIESAKVDRQRFDKNVVMCLFHEKSRDPGKTDG